MCHLALLLPFFGLPVFWLWPLSTALPSYLVILLLSAGIYYYAIAAMRRKVVTGPEALLHSEGVVVSQYGLKTTVRVQGELWSAHSKDELVPGDIIHVVDVDGLSLQVRRYVQPNPSRCNLTNN